MPPPVFAIGAAAGGLAAANAIGGAMLASELALSSGPLEAAISQAGGGLFGGLLGGGTSGASVFTPANIFGGVLSLATANAGAQSAQYAAQAQAQAMQYNASLAANQAIAERRRAQEEAEDFRRRQRQVEARGRALRGATGLTMAGTPLLLEDSLESEVDLNIQRVLEGGERRATALEAEAALERTRARNARAQGSLRAGTTLLTGFHDAYSRFA